MFVSQVPLFTWADPWKAAVTHQEESTLVIPVQELCMSLPKRRMDVVTAVVCRVPGFSELNQFVSAEKSEVDLVCGQCCDTIIKL